MNSYVTRLALLAIAALPSWPQISQNLLSVEPMPPVVMKRGTVAQAKIRVRLSRGYHMNSNKPLDEYLIPLRLTWTAGSLEVVKVVYPEGKVEKYSFSEKPLSVLTGDVDLVTEFKVPQLVQTGVQTIPGKLRYQACDDRQCFTPKTIDVRLPVDIQ